MRQMKLTSLVIAAVALTSPLAAGEWWIPAAAHGAGAQGSTWRTDLTVRNLGTADETVTVALLPRGADNASPASSADLVVPALGTVQVSDALQALFAFDGAAALRLSAPSDLLVVASRTYNLASGAGTFGQSIPGVAASGAVGAGETVLLLGLSGTEGRRTNLGWVSLEATQVTVSVELFDGGGSQLASRTFTELGHGHSQLNDLFASLGTTAQGNAYARVSATGRFLPYASVIAAGSNDPVYVAARSGLELGTELVIPAVVNAAGLNDTTWRSDVCLLNQGSSTSTVELTLWRQGQTTPLTTSLTVASGQQVVLEDVVGELFAVDGSQGALVLHSDQLLLATSRAYNTAPEGTYGQFIPAQALRSLGGAGETLLLVGVDHGGAYRSNIGLVAVGAPATVVLDLRAAGGEVLATTSRNLSAGQQIQTSVASLFGIGSEVAGASVEVRVEGGAEAKVAPYLSMIDNTTGDPTFSPAVRTLVGAADAEEIADAVVVVSGALGDAADAAGPSATAPPKDGCVTVTYSGDTIRPGESPEGKCWQAAVVYAGCVVVLPDLGLTFTRDGSAEGDVCIVDDYPSHLSMDITTTSSDASTGEHHSLTQVADLGLAFTFDGWRVATAHVDGTVGIELDGAVADAWGDLTWSAGVAGLEPYPVGTLLLTFPSTVDGVAVTVEATVTFDGTAWAHVLVRVGAWRTAFWFNLTTREIRPA